MVTHVRSIFLTALFWASLGLADVDPIVLKGDHFFYKTNGTQFLIKGVAYQQDTVVGGSLVPYSDPLADVASCTRDIPYLAAVANVIRVYAIDPTADHTTCMQLLQDNGIYVVADLSQPKVSINRDSPRWDLDLFSRYKSVVDTMSKYPNTLMFFAGNEVSNNSTNTQASAFIRAAIRDTRMYIKAQGYRPIPVGYSTNDDAEIRDPLADYFDCDNGIPESRSEVFAINLYEWCGDSSFEKSGYADRTAEYQNYSQAIYLSEYGCNLVRPRLFTEVNSIYTQLLQKNGGIVYQYFEEANQYGLVTVAGNSVSPLPDYENLKSQLANVSPTLINSANYQPSNTVPRACPPTDAPNWKAAASPLPPTPDENFCNCMVSSLSCVVRSGLNSNTTSTLFSQVCGMPGNPCLGISTNATTGVYGAFSMCDSQSQLSYAFNRYYQLMRQDPTACDFAGNAQIVKPSANSDCKAQMNEVGPQATQAPSQVNFGNGKTVNTNNGQGTNAHSGASMVKYSYLLLATMMML